MKNGSGNFLPFAEAKQFVQSLGLGSPKMSRSNSKKATMLSFDEAKELVQTLKLKSRKNWPQS